MSFSLTTASASRSRRSAAGAALVASIVLGWTLGVSTAVSAASTFRPTRFNDPAPNGCLVGDCSLREAVIAANAAPGSTIVLKAGTYRLTRKGVDGMTANPAIGDLDIRAGMTINGDAAGGTFVQFGAARGQGGDRIFDVTGPGKVTISHLTARFGSDVEAKTGGCIRNFGNLSLVNVTVTGCVSALGGGGIASYNALTITDSVISNNTASSGKGQVNGGGITGGPKAPGVPGSVTIVHSQIINNTARSTRPAVGYGGGFANTGTMTIRNSVISGNQADSSAGGLSNSTLTIVNSTVQNNKATRDAGGVTNDGLLTVNASTFSDNVSGFHCTGDDCNNSYAGGLLNTATGTSKVFNSTFSGNSCQLSGGGIVNSGSGTVRLYSSTLVGNSCPIAPGLGSNPSGKTYIKDTILAKNGAGPDCTSSVTSLGHNIIGNAAGCSIGGDTTGNQTGVDPDVGTLQDNGGPTFTRALLAGSPAIDAGAACTDTAGHALTTDQRGFTRPVGGACDIGSFEKGS